MFRCIFIKLSVIIEIYIYIFFEKNIIIKVVKFLQNFIRFDDIWYIEIIVSNNTNVTWIKIMGSIIG